MKKKTGKSGTKKTLRPLWLLKHGRKLSYRIILIAQNIQIISQAEGPQCQVTQRKQY